MPHKIIILPSGEVIDEGHEPGEGGGNRSKPVSIEDYETDHAPSQIVIEQPTEELTELILEVLRKYFKKE